MKHSWNLSGSVSDLDVAVTGAAMKFPFSCHFVDIEAPNRGNIEEDATKVCSLSGYLLYLEMYLCLMLGI